jgi:hypothetical protein
MSKKQQRWHDKKPELAKVIHFLGSLPNDVQTIIGDCVVKIAEKEYKVSQLMNNLKSLGSDKILGLHQSQKKRRNYDRNPVTHKAVNHVYILSESDQAKMTKQVLNLMDSVFSYFEIHQTFKAPAEKETLQDLANAFAEGGLKQATAYNQALRQKLAEKAKQKEYLKESQGDLIIGQ